MIKFFLLNIILLFNFSYAEDCIDICESSTIIIKLCGDLSNISNISCVSMIDIINNNFVNASLDIVLPTPSS